MGFKDKKGVQELADFNPVCPQRGPYEASEGIHPVMGKGKNWGWASSRFPLTPSTEFSNLQFEEKAVRCQLIL
jgi:hypothetical protein